MWQASWVDESRSCPVIHSQFRMDHVDQSVIARTENNASSNMSVGSRITRNCSRCRNHGQKIAQKGHGRDCKYRDCVCERCKLFSDRRSMMSRHNELRRTMTQDEVRKYLLSIFFLFFFFFLLLIITYFYSTSIF